MENVEHSQTGREKKRCQQIWEVETLLWTFGVSSIVEITDIKSGLLSTYLFQITQQHGGFTKFPDHDKFV